MLGGVSPVLVSDCYCCIIGLLLVFLLYIYFCSIKLFFSSGCLRIYSTTQILVCE